MNKLVKLIKILLTVPALYILYSRNIFSSMRRLKIYSRASMTARKLDSLEILHVHSKLTNECFDKKNTIINNFIVQNPIRKSFFAVINTVK